MAWRADVVHLNGDGEKGCKNTSIKNIGVRNYKYELN